MSFFTKLLHPGDFKAETDEKMTRKEIIDFNTPLIFKCGHDFPMKVNVTKP